MPNQGFAALTYEDYGGEKSTVRVRADVLTAANFDAQVLAQIALADAIAGITLGLKTKVTQGNENQVVLGPASDVDAQREKKWLVQYHDGVSMKRYTLEIPCADLAQLDPNDRANAAIGDGGVVDAFISAFEAFALTPDGNTPIVDEITFVGRNV